MNCLLYFASRKAVAINLQLIDVACYLFEISETLWNVATHRLIKCDTDNMSLHLARAVHLDQEFCPI